MAHPYAPAFQSFAQQEVPRIVAKGKGKGDQDTSNDWDCPACGDRNFARRMSCRKCEADNPNARAPDMNDMGFKTVMCTFFQSNRCTKGVYCSFAHGDEELQLGRQMLETKADSIPAPGLHESPLEVQQFLARHNIKQLPLKQFLTMDPWQQNLVMQRGPLTDSRDPTAVLISRMVTVKKMSNFGAQAAKPFAAAAQTFQNPIASFAQGQATPSGAVYQVMFHPGPLGLGADWPTGRVDKVMTGGQGLANGVAVGDWFAKINDIDYNEGLLDAAIAIGQPFTVTFTRSEETVVPQDLGQFAANLGMEWAFGGAQA